MPVERTYPNESGYPESARACLEEVIAICRKYGFSLSHEDGHGSFILEARTDEKNAEYNEQWLRGATVETRSKP